MCGRHITGIIHIVGDWIHFDFLLKLLLRLRIDEPADTERFRGDDSFARKPCDSFEKQFRITHGRAEQASGIGDTKFRGADGDRCKQLRIESVTDKLRVRVQTL